MKINLQLDHRTILANKAQPIHFALQIQAENISSPRPRPAAFCVVLDTSGSMNGQPLERAKEATCLALRNLRREDQFALVLFSTSAQVAIPLQACPDKQRLLDLVHKIVTAGSTNLTGGWMLGRDELKKAEPEASRRLLLLSDGLLNVGIIEPAQVRQIVANGLETDAIRTSSLGFGDNYDEKLLADLASATNGQFYDADSPEKLPAIFAQELDGLQKLAVQNLRLRIKRLDFCESFEPLSGYPSVDLPDGRTEFALGDLVSDEERISCFALEVLPLPCVQGAPVASLEGEKLLAVEILYDEIGEAGIASRTHEQIVRVQTTQNPKEVKVNETVVGWMAMQKAGLTIKRATDEMTSGSREKAKSILQEAIRFLSERGSKEKVEQALEMLRQLQAKLDHGVLSARDIKEQKAREFYSRRTSSRMPPGANPFAPPPTGTQPPGEPGKPGSGPVA
jgi:Ca-activated chloride channel family protein